MVSTIGICGHTATGSSAFVDLLHEYDDAQVLDSREFVFTYFPDGLEDLEYHVKNYHKYMSSTVALDRFRKFLGKKYDNHGEIFLKKIIQISWNGFGNIDILVRPLQRRFAKRFIFKLATILRIKKLHHLYPLLFPYKMELSIMPEEFDLAARTFVSDVLNDMGRENTSVLVLDQPFEGCNPVKSFKFFENPRAVIVERDPRDHYLFAKNFLRTRGRVGYQIPCDNVDDYIKYFRLIHQSPPNLRDRKDIIYFNFEELIYDYENTVKKVSDFVGVTQHTYKGEYFKPSHSRNNTQLYKKYVGFENDVKKIEKELPEFIFHFENYPDIEPEGGMFWGSQIRKRK